MGFRKDFLENLSEGFCFILGLITFVLCRFIFLMLIILVIITAIIETAILVLPAFSIALITDEWPEWMWKITKKIISFINWFISRYP